MNGSALTQTFSSKEQLSAVRLYVEMNRTDGDQPFSLMTSFPRKIFSTEDYEKPLDVLGRPLFNFLYYFDSADVSLYHYYVLCAVTV